MPCRNTGIFTSSTFRISFIAKFHLHTKPINIWKLCQFQNINEDKWRNIFTITHSLMLLVQWVFTIYIIIISTFHCTKSFQILEKKCNIVTTYLTPLSHHLTNGYSKTWATLTPYLSYIDLALRNPRACYDWQDSPLMPQVTIPSMEPKGKKWGLNTLYSRCLV